MSSLMDDTEEESPFLSPQENKTITNLNKDYAYRIFTLKSMSKYEQIQ